jgi:hypothetical protein
MCKNIPSLAYIHPSFRRTKDKFDPLLSQDVYEISCPCSKSYIHQMEWSIQTHLKEHIANNFHNHLRESNIKEHFNNTKHLVFFEHTKILS